MTNYLSKIKNAIIGQLCGSEIHKAYVISVNSIASHTYHIKIHSESFKHLPYTNDYTTKIFFGNPNIHPSCECRKYSFWNFNYTTKTADIAICTFSNGPGANWIKGLTRGDEIYFKEPVSKSFPQTAEKYLLIGEPTSLAHLYGVRQNFPQSSKVAGLIYTSSVNDVYFDLDNTHPFQYILCNSDIENTCERIIEKVPESLEDTIIYNLGHPQVCIVLHKYFKSRYDIDMRNVRTKAFWKTH